MSDTDLEQQIAETLAAHARELTVTPRPFEPVHPLLDLGDGDAVEAPPSGPARRRLLAAAAAVVVVAAGLGVARFRGDAELAAGPPRLPDDAYLPTWEGPEGWELSSVDWISGRSAWITGSMASDSGAGPSWSAIRPTRTRPPGRC